MRKWKNDFKTSNETESWYDMEEDWSLIEASLAKQYGINIPLATQGFINNRLVSYDFGNGTFAYKITDKNKKASNVMHKYLIEISKCVKSEFKDNIKELKTKLKEMNGGVK